MKKFIISTFALLLSISILAQTPAIDRLARKMKRANQDCERTDINVPGWLVRFGSNFIDADELEGIDIKRIGKRISHVRVLAIDNVKTTNGDDIQSFIKDMNDEGFEELITVRSDGDNVRIMVYESKEFIRHLVVMASEKQGDFALVSIEGKFSMDDINKMIENSEINTNGISINKKKSKSKTQTVRSED